ncbi:hypothetical protein ACFY4C_06050 [Actinomadura viridis]|uniref:hypothetical protein n=1 Tax=Actinomadura viridis TaxID=58110 RepID=UPI0036D20777
MERHGPGRDGSRPSGYQPGAGTISGPSAGAPRARRTETTIDELFLTALTRIGHEDAYHLWPEGVRDRFRSLVGAATREDPERTARFLRWLRTETPMRYAALAGASAFAAERLAGGRHGMTRQVVGSVLLRADDPGHLLAHWLHTYGRAVPKPVKRGVADAVQRLYDERALLAYDTGGLHLSIPGPLHTAMTFPDRNGGHRHLRPLRFGDVIGLVHPAARDARQADLYRYALARRRDPRCEVPASLTALSAVGGRPDRPGWERLVASMPLGELVRSLRRLDAAGLPFEAAMAAAARLADPAEIRAAGLLPLRLAAARSAVAHQRWAPLLERAAGHALGTLPAIPGRTLIVIDHLGDAGAVLGLTLAQLCADANVVTCEGTPFAVLPGESPLHGLHRWRASGLPPVPVKADGAVRSAFAGHDRVVISGAPLADLAGIAVPAPVYAWEPEPTWFAPLTGRVAPVPPPDPDRLVFRGLTDAAYPVIPWIEGARRGAWPF